MQVFKICRVEDWRSAVQSGFFEGSLDDKRDGFIHLSTGEQLAETAAKHFRGQEGLLLIALDSERLGSPLKWEVSRGGVHFPHLYGPLPASAALWTRPIRLNATGVPVVSPEATPC
jgi:uncharacterized protein (DUF952 family)